MVSQHPMRDSVFLYRTQYTGVKGEWQRDNDMNYLVRTHPLLSPSQTGTFGEGVFLLCLREGDKERGANAPLKRSGKHGLPGMGRR
jgi:hypothetical protein